MCQFGLFRNFCNCSVRAWFVDNSLKRMERGRTRPFNPLTVNRGGVKTPSRQPGHPMQSCIALRVHQTIVPFWVTLLQNEEGIKAVHCSLHDPSWHLGQTVSEFVKKFLVISRSHQNGIYLLQPRAILPELTTSAESHRRQEVLLMNRTSRCSYLFTLPSLARHVWTLQASQNWYHTGHIEVSSKCRRHTD